MTKILSRCVFVSVFVKMGLSLSLLRVDFSLYRIVDKEFFLLCVKKCHLFIVLNKYGLIY